MCICSSILNSKKNGIIVISFVGTTTKPMFYSIIRSVLISVSALFRN